jgi:hypothetical protein
MRRFTLTIAIVTSFIFPAHAYRHHGLICASVQMQHFGIRDPRFKLARSWLAFPRTSAHPGAVAFWWRKGTDSAGHRGGHVARIVSVNGCSAVVTDEAGTYSRDICNATIIQP